MRKSTPRRTHLRPSQRIYLKRRIVLFSAGVVTFVGLSVFIYIQFTQYEYAEANNRKNNTMALAQPDLETPKPIIEKSFVDKYPVTLANFTSKVNPVTVELNWMCAAEKDNDHFVVERSVAGAMFTELGTVESVGSIQKCSKYSFIDKDPGAGVMIYRLRQVSRDGSSSFIAIEKTLKENKNKDKALYVESVEPKKFKNYLNINYFTQSEGGLSVEIFDSNGKRIFKSYTQSKKGYNTCRFINAGMLTEDDYTLRISNPIGAYVEKLKREV